MDSEPPTAIVNSFTIIQRLRERSARVILQHSQVEKPEKEKGW